MKEDEVPIDDAPQVPGAARAGTAVPGAGPSGASAAFSSGAARLGAAWREILRTGLGLACGGSAPLSLAGGGTEDVLSHS
ncbi:hypothetical protein P9869_26390 [Streptomyces ossamyceticus]|nr:hypothetical protein [Streptomyces ossamyceticus]